MAVLHYHIHFARPAGFADPTKAVIRLMLMSETDYAPYAVWIFRRGGWSPARYGTVPPPT